jgi:hypothetical protein
VRQPTVREPLANAFPSDGAIATTAARVDFGRQYAIASRSIRILELLERDCSRHNDRTGEGRGATDRELSCLNDRSLQREVFRRAMTHPDETVALHAHRVKRDCGSVGTSYPHMLRLVQRSGLYRTNSRATNEKRTESEEASCEAHKVLRVSVTQNRMPNVTGTNQAMPSGSTDACRTNPGYCW